MSELTRDLTVHPLFFEALGEAFYPPSDPVRLPQTLGNLALETIERGVTIPANPGFAVFGHNPSWAPNAAVEATCHIRNGSMTLHSLVLNTKDKNPLARLPDLGLYDQKFNGDDDGIQITERGTATTLPLGRGERLTIARQAASRAAQTFFDTVR